jgi:hypothetical protein
MQLPLTAPGVASRLGRCPRQTIARRIGDLGAGDAGTGNAGSILPSSQARAVPRVNAATFEQARAAFDLTDKHRRFNRGAGHCMDGPQS